ncbi:MAG: hypothetical protein AAEJ46_10255 [Planctomycetota bacterium]|jgi:uncharacterized membrane protein YgaE (UPF0421/DUF939 family)
MKKVTMVMVFLCFALAVVCFGASWDVRNVSASGMLTASAIALGLGTIAAALQHQQNPPSGS